MEEALEVVVVRTVESVLGVLEHAGCFFGMDLAIGFGLTGAGMGTCNEDCEG